MVKVCEEGGDMGQRLALLELLLEPKIGDSSMRLKRVYR